MKVYKNIEHSPYRSCPSLALGFGYNSRGGVDDVLRQRYLPLQGKQG